MTMQAKNSKNQAAALGFWAALATAALEVWWFVTFIPYQPNLTEPWVSLAEYAAKFQPAPLLAWVIPCFFIGPAVLVMMACLYVWTDEEKNIWGLLALLFAVPAAAILCLNYYIQMTVVLRNLLSGTTDGLSLLLYANPYPFSIPGAMEGVGYGFICVSFLFASRVFGKGKLQSWVRWTFIGNGLTGLVVFIDPLFRIPLPVLMVDGIASGIFLTLAPILMAVLFRRSKGIQPGAGMTG